MDKADQMFYLEHIYYFLSQEDQNTISSSLHTTLISTEDFKLHMSQKYMYF